MRETSRRMALCGMLTALAAALLLLGGMLPLATYCAPILAMAALLPVESEYGWKMGLTAYAAVTLLGLLLAPDPELSLFFAFFGYYPLVRPRLDRLKGPLRWCAKLVFCNLSIAVMYVCLLFFFRGSVEEVGAPALAAVLLVLANVTFFLLDVALRRFTVLYRTRIRKRLFH